MAKGKRDNRLNPVRKCPEDELSTPQSVQKERRPDQSSVVPHKSDVKQEPVWLATDSNLRPLNEEEIGRLQRRLGRTVDQNYLVHWMSQAIRDTLRLWSDPRQPTLRERRDSLVKIAKEGRRWIATVDTLPGLSQLGRELDDVKRAVDGLCHRAELFAKEIQVKRGNRPASAAVPAFIDRMIGIAMTAKVYPSSEGRALRSLTAPRDPPVFFLFVVEALQIAAEVIGSSPLPEEQKYVAVNALSVPSRSALSKLIEEARGRISDYRESEHGLISSTRTRDPGLDETC